ncbi:GNAT family N-acetyltransferase [Rhizobium sp. NPDC090275]|uniref:GNAT family N-acetyltransferase n=1 Tax=Rhizobium sp. NPDC090275 TaxID=3364498 RepID=UPI000DDD452A
MASDIEISELFGLEEIVTIYSLFRQVHTLDEASFRARLSAMCAQGNYRCIAAYVEGRMVGVAGFWIGTQLWCGKYIEADHVVVDADVRGMGIGARLMAWIEAEGEREACALFRIAAVLSNLDARRFYARNGFFDDGILMAKALSRGAAAFPEYVARRDGD